jgi:hypothetical protein
MEDHANAEGINMIRKRQIEAANIEKQMMYLQQSADTAYLIGWNDALELAASKIENDFVKAFGKDTLASISVYLRKLQK